MNSIARAALLALLALVFLGPIAALLFQLDRGVFLELFDSPAFGRALRTTLLSSGGASLLSVAAGTFFARQFALHQWRGQRAQRLLLIVPYLIPNFILAAAWVVAWNPATGLLNFVLPFPFGLYGLWGMTVLFAVVHLPVAFLLLEEKFRRIDASLREAARLSGAGPLLIFARIELPLLLPSVVGAFGLCFSLDISAFAIPAWIGAPERAYPLTYKIYQAIQVGGAEGMPQAAGWSLVLLLLALPPLLVTRWMQRTESRRQLVSGKAARPEQSQQGRGAFAGFQAAFWVSQVATWVAPLGALFLTTLVKPGCLQQQGLSCLGEGSLRAYRYVLFELAETPIALRGSLLYGTLSAVLVVGLAVGLLAAVHRAPRALAATEWILALPLATPGAILALGLIVCASGRFGLNLYNTPWIVVAAYVIKHQSLAFSPLRTGLSSISGSLFEAARLSGAGGPAVWRRIVLPLLKPELLGGFFLVLIPMLGELTMSVFLTSPSFRSIGTVLFDLQDYADQGSAAALSVLLVLLVLAANQLARLLSRGRFGY